jgi:glycosyltransferase involved in cell wall biosynthesis
MSGNPRVLYLAPSSNKKGQVSRYSFLDEEIRALADAGIDAYVLSLAESGDSDHGRLHLRAIPMDSVEERGRTLRFIAQHRQYVPWPGTRPIDFVRLYRALRIERLAAEVVQREEIALIHSYFAWPRGFGGLLARAATGVPLVAGLRGADINTLPAVRYGARLDRTFDRNLRRLLGVADRTIAVSQFLQEQAIALGANPAAARVILKGVRLDVFNAPANRADARAAVGAGPHPLILAVGGMIRIKGVDHVLEALARVRAEGLEFSFVVCGYGPEQTRLEAQVERLGLRDRVRFPGKVSRSDIANYFAAADLFVHGALIEASGNAILEALASGVPVVCTDAGGPAEYVLDGVGGFVVPVADPAAMAERIARLLRDHDLRRELGRRARERAQAMFAYERMIADTLAVYDSVLSDASTRSRTAGLTTELSHA